MINAQKFYTVSEIKDYLKISKTAAYDLTKRTDFPVCYIGSSIRIPVKEFENWVTQQCRIPAALRGT